MARGNCSAEGGWGTGGMQIKLTLQNLSHGRKKKHFVCEIPDNCIWNFVSLSISQMWWKNSWWKMGPRVRCIHAPWKVCLLVTCPLTNSGSYPEVIASVFPRLPAHLPCPQSTSSVWRACYLHRHIRGKYSQKKMNLEPAERTHESRVSATLTEDLSSVLNTHVASLKTVCNSRGYLY